MGTEGIELEQARRGADADPLAFTQDETFRAKGRGLNSIPVRFALMGVVVGSIAFALQYHFVFSDRVDDLSPGDIALIALTVCLPAVVTFFAARNLAGMIGALRTSTLAILKGEINRPVDVDCACEVGGLADSFRAMVARLNNNILRMNILAYTDSVTGLPNRTVVNHVLDLIKQNGMEKCRATMFFIDLDGFKRINDTFGHDAGDEMLRAASQRIVEHGFGIERGDLETCTTAFGELCQSCPSKLVFARFAGDEFVAILPGDLTKNEAGQIGQAIVKALDAPFPIFGNDIRIGASVGIACLDETVSDPRNLLVHADIAMYRAKEQGRNCVAFFDVELKAQVEERNLLEKELREALDRNELTVHFQPRICSRTHKVQGVEALARWDHPTRGMIPPDVFIPLAEQTGCMAQLGDTMLRLAARQAREWQQAGLRIPVAVNMSPAQFDSPELVADIIAILEDIQLDQDLLELEITETLAMRDFAASKRRIDNLRMVGLRIAIDDFGTGYSNLSQLSRLNIDIIKIDRSLVAGIGRNDKAEALLKATIGMAHALGLTVVAEGIEQVEQLHMLRGMGCDQVQGFYIAHPMPAEEFQSWNDRYARGGLDSVLDYMEARLAI